MYIFGAKISIFNNFWHIIPEDKITTDYQIPAPKKKGEFTTLGSVKSARAIIEETPTVIKNLTGYAHALSRHGSCQFRMKAGALSEGLRLQWRPV